MSVVLNALRAKEAARTAGVSTSRAREGLFVAHDARQTSRNSIRLGVLLFCLFAAIVFATFRLSALYFSTAQGTLLAPKAVAPVIAVLPKAVEPAKAEPPTAEPQVTLQQAQALLADGKVDESLAAYEKLAKLHPKDATILNQMGLILMKQDRGLEAEKRLSEAVALNPNCAECYNSLGLLATSKGYTLQAERHFTTALDLDGDYAEPYFNLAVLLEKNGDEGGAIANFEDFLKRTKNKNSPIARQVKKHLAKLNS